MLAKDQKKVIFDDLRILANLMSHSVTQETLIAYIETLAEFDFNLIRSAIHRAGKTKRFFPKPVELIELINPPIRKEEGDLIAGKILSAIHTYGVHQPGKARKHLGHVAWRAVELIGDWTIVCNTPPSQLNTLRAQIRDLSLSILKGKEIEHEREARVEHHLAERYKITDKNIRKDRTALEVHDFEQKKKAQLAKFNEEFGKLIEMPSRFKEESDNDPV